MELEEVRNEEFRRDGFWVARGLLSKEEVAPIRDRSDLVAGEIAGYSARNQAARNALLERYHEHVTPRAAPDQEFATATAEPISPQHLRRGDRIYPARLRPVNAAAVAAGNASGDPFSSETTAKQLFQVPHLVDNDPLFGSLASNPKILAVMQDLLAPNLKLWFDHLFSKPPYNDTPPYGGANRYHQDGFFHLSRRSVTCWVALDEITEHNGCLRFIPLTAGYGQFEFDALGTGITAEMLEQEVLVPMQPGDVSFHDHWTVHATGPNETGQRRRGWAGHFADAESRFGNFGGDINRPLPSYQAPDGTHIRNGIIHGNRIWPLLRGREFPGCI